jgi:stage II sporulation protein D
MRRAPLPTIVALVLIVFLSSDGVRTVNGGFDNAPAQDEHTVRIGVLGLFHPREFVVTATVKHALVLRSGRHSIVLERSGIPSAKVRLENSEVVVSSGSQMLHASTIHVASREAQPVEFVLEIPGKIIRRYQGVLDVKPSAGDLSAVVTLDLETAVASVVAAESTQDTPTEALKANAVAARSYFISGRGRHPEFDFCDTTHCQYFRTPPPADSLAARAIAETRSLILAYQGRPLAAMYTRSCSGRTRTPAELGLGNSAYPYYSVNCEHCRAHPARWTSRLSPQDASSLRTGNESARLAIDHRLGWSAVPSNDFSLKKDGDDVLLEGIGSGHGIGLCQAGARAMAQAGANFQQILDHYYPNTNVVSYSGSILATGESPDR